MKDFEELFPLPFKYDDVHGQLKDKDAMCLMTVNYMGMTSEQVENDSVLGDYLTTCANLMPEAIEIIKYALEQESARCEQCQRKNQDCPSCRHSDRIYNMKKLLAKLEGGGNNAQNS